MFNMNTFILISSVTASLHYITDWTMPDCVQREKNDACGDPWCLCRLYIFSYFLLFF